MVGEKNPAWDNWDEFARKLQELLIEPLGLRNVTLLVKRHNGGNCPVHVTLLPMSIDSVALELTNSLYPLSISQLTITIQSTLDVLLEDCKIAFGDVRFEVHDGLLTESVFSYSNRPDESTSQFFF